MERLSRNRFRHAAPACCMVVACFGLAGADLLAQTAAGPWWSAPPSALRGPVVWAEPVWVGRPPTIAAGAAPTETHVSSDAADGTPPPDGRLSVTLTEAFLSALFAREVTDSGPIRDCLLGANIYGDQFTVTHLSVDCQPCRSQGRVLMRLTGTVSDHTVGVTRPASVQTEGNHTFEMTKQVDFDGRQFTTRTPAAWVTPQIAYRGATTIVSGVPVIGSIGTAIALNEAGRRHPAAVQFALRRVTRTAAPRFNQEVDQKLSLANERLSGIGPLLSEKLGIGPGDLIVTTSDDRFDYALRLPNRAAYDLRGRPVSLDQSGPVFLDVIEGEEVDGAQELREQQVERPSGTAAILSPPLLSGDAATIRVHEEFVNHLLARLPLNGRELPDRMIDGLMESLRSVLANRSLSGVSWAMPDNAAPEFATVVLDRHRPVSLRFADGQAIVTLRAGFRTTVGGELPTQNVEIPFHLTNAERHVVLEPDGVTVAPAAADADGPLAGLARPVIRQQIEQRLKRIELPRALPLAIGQLKPTTLRVREVVMNDGWLVIALD